jgi:hypothetical protein
VQCPIRLPESAISLLSKDGMVRNVMEYEHVARMPREWFLASIVHLRGTDEADLLVMADGPMRGANVNNFWILRPVQKGYAVILNGPALDLFVKKTRTNGYRDIELAGSGLL